MEAGTECQRAGMCHIVDTKKPAPPRMATPNPHDLKSFEKTIWWLLACVLKGMLHYYMHDGPAAFRFELAGDLATGDAARLEQEWHTASSTIGDRTLIVDLSFVTAIDEAARSLFRRWHAAGAQFAAISPQSRNLVETITGRPFLQRQSQEPTYEPWLSGGWYRGLSAIPLLAFVILLTPSTMQAAEDGASIAFARYISTYVTTTPQEDDGFPDRGDTILEIDASLPKLGKQGRMEVIWHSGPSGRPEYEVVSFEGDSTVKQQVIARYLEIEQQAYALPVSSVAITPDNYKFRYAGSVESGGNRSYIFAIKPRHGGGGLIDGHLWIDQATGAAVHQDGRVVKRASIFIRQIRITRDSGSRAGVPYLRVTHVDIDTRLAGRAELTIRERPSTSILNAGGLQ